MRNQKVKEMSDVKLIIKKLRKQVLNKWSFYFYNIIYIQFFMEVLTNCFPNNTFTKKYLVH